MPLDLVRLRALRSRAEKRSSSFVEDFRPFLRPDNTCCRLPSKKSEAISVTTACTCLMAAVLTKRAETLYARHDKRAAADAVRSAFRLIVDSPWKSVGLPEKNSFTRMLALRTAGILKHANF